MLNDASFAWNSDSSSQLSFLVFLIDEAIERYIICYSSSKSWRVARSALAGKLFELIQSFGYTNTMHIKINEIFNNWVLLKLLKNSKSFYDAAIGVDTAT